ncbi:MAG: EAL domain-containing protein [Gammaproteobacteria bacterium]|nr:EAL domain-containing protein [Gammaproteobacteria bacterium]
MTNEDNVPKIVKGLIAFAHAMDFEIIAEGIETDIQAKTLKSLGTHMAQGWLYSKPLNAPDFINFHSEYNARP